MQRLSELSFLMTMSILQTFVGILDLDCERHLSLCLAVLDDTDESTARYRENFEEFWFNDSL